MQDYNDPYAAPPQQPQYNQQQQQQGFNNNQQQQGFNNNYQQQNFNNQQNNGFQNAPQYNYNNNNPPNDYENNNNNLNQPLNKQELADDEPGLLGKSRQGFVRKVYLILTAMLSLVVGMTAISMSNYEFRSWQADNIWLYAILGVVQLCIAIAICYFPKLAINYPGNYVLVSIFAFCFAWMISTICGFYQEDDQQEVVFCAAGLTLGITVALTIYAMTTKKDFTMMGGMLFCCFMAFFLFGIFCWIFNTYWMNIMYCTFGVILFSIYLIYDTQLIMGGKRFELDYDHYILGAMILFVDIIRIFLYLLSLLSRR